MKGMTTGADLCEVVKRALQNLDIPTENPAERMSGGAPSMASSNSGESVPATSDVKNTTNWDLMTFHCLIYQENLCAKCLRTTYVVTVV
jgi:hypothetical protein